MEGLGTTPAPQGTMRDTKMHATRSKDVQTWNTTRLSQTKDWAQRQHYGKVAPFTIGDNHKQGGLYWHLKRYIDTHRCWQKMMKAWDASKTKQGGIGLTQCQAIKDICAT